ncbi:MAG TPA: hypothetical protein VKH15_14880 [Candidatus Acidoferrum sp.]|nr:hypothetical protein [Candidatus Acidoferrum sp.]
MRVLKLRAIYLYNSARIPEQNLRGRFHDPRLAGPGWTQKQEIAHRSPGGVQARTEDLKQVNKRLDAFRLADDLRAKRPFKVSGTRASDTWIQLLSSASFHGIVPFRVPIAQDAPRVSAMR